MLFINPPFGNYVDLPYTTSIKGSYTLNPRPGLISQIIKTLRYSSAYKGWINKIGLRNKGIDYAIKNYDGTHIVSIAILDKDEIKPIENKIPKDMNIELNVSCPNTEHGVITKGLSIFLNPQRKWCIIKLSPTADIDLINSYYRQGFRQFHCCNTMPIKAGGLSGPSITTFSQALTYDIRRAYPDCTIIGGGGITNMIVAEKYFRFGANHIGVSTLLFNPFKFTKFYLQYINSKYCKKDF